MKSLGLDGNPLTPNFTSMPAAHNCHINQIDQGQQICLCINPPYEYTSWVLDSLVGGKLRILLCAALGGWLEGWRGNRLIVLCEELVIMFIAWEGGEAEQLSNRLLSTMSAFSVIQF